MYREAKLVLHNGEAFKGISFGAERSLSGEVVFNTGMTGYPEALTDPSYKGQILVLTYPLIGNYGVPHSHEINGVDTNFESEQIHVQGLVVSEYSLQHSHWNAKKSLGEWLKEQNVPALYGVDTRKLTKMLREKGCMLGKLMVKDENIPHYDPNKDNLVQQVSTKDPVEYSKKGNTKKIVLVDCGMKNNMITCLLERGANVVRVPYDYDFTKEDYDGVLISNGPGDPTMCQSTIAHIKKAMNIGKPIFGICLGNQLLSLAAGAKTYKLKYGHRSQNQPCVRKGTKKCIITTQNHGFAVDGKTLPPAWEEYFVNANDQTNEGIKHKTKPFMSVQFHPESKPGPVDAEYLFDEFVKLL